MVPPADLQRHGARPVRHLRALGQHVHHALDVGQRLLDLAVDHAHEVERDEELQQQRIDHDEVADGLGAGHDVEHGHGHAAGERRGEDDGLAGVEHGERGVALDAGLLVDGHRLIVAAGLALLGAEVFHGLVVEEAVDRLGVGLGVALVHGAADLDAPVGRPHRVPEIEHDHQRDRAGVAPVERVEQHGQHQRELDDGRHEGHQRHARDVLDAEPAALQHAREPAGLALQVKAQREAMHVLEGGERELAHRMHGDPGEHALAHLHQQRHGHAGEAVEQGGQHRRADQPRERLRGGNGAAGGRHQRVRRPLEGEGHGDRDELGRQHQHEREDDGGLQVGPIRRPDVGRKRPQHAKLV